MSDEDIAVLCEVVKFLEEAEILPELKEKVENIINFYRQ